MINIQGVSAVKVALQRPARKPRKQSKPYKKRTRWSPKKGTGATAELSRILWFRADGWTLEAIGDEVGVSRERIRQILKQNGIVGRLKQEGPHRIKNFQLVMRKWLYWAGFRFCNICDTWKDSCDFSAKNQHGCRKCNADRQRERNRTNPKAKEYRRRYAKTEKYKQYQREYAKRPEVKQRLNGKYGKSSYWKMRNDPEKWAAYKAAKQEYDRKRTPARRTQLAEAKVAHSTEQTD